MSQLDYALIGNCQISALVDPSAKIVWCCMPRLDSPSVFASLLGGDNAGFWAVIPEHAQYTTKQSYITNTNIVRTEFHLSNGDQFDVIDFVPRFSQRDGFFKPASIVRIVRPVRGYPRVVLKVEPKFGYGEWQAQASSYMGSVRYQGPQFSLHLEANVPHSFILESRPIELRKDRYFVLSHGAPLGIYLKFACEEYFDRTLDYWRGWVKHCNIPFDYQAAVIRSALALKLHIFEDTGAIIAATTTSIPESPDGGRNWDYRYCWLRDAYFVINALNKLGQFDEMEHFIEFLHSVAANEDKRGAKGRLQPVYGVSGEPVLLERELPWLKGFKDYGPVRVGNAAYTHVQHDVYGEMVLAVSPIFFDSRLNFLDRWRTFEIVESLVTQAIERFEQPDSGLWEFRSGHKHYLFSKLLCWAAVDRGLRIARKLGVEYCIERWSSAKKAMRDAIENDGWDKDLGGYVQAYENRMADASNLLMGTLQFHPGDHPRMQQMVEAYEKRLMSGGYVFRYRTDDDFGKPLHAFTICTFWMIDALVGVGRKDHAKQLFEQLISRTNHLGLLSEDIDPVSGELWGNFPQTYSHVGIINSAFLLSRDWSEAF